VLLCLYKVILLLFSVNFILESLMTNSQLPAVALITGGSRGIGLAIAEKLANETIKVVITDLVAPETPHENLIFRSCDVTKSEDVDSLFKWLHLKGLLPQLLILNAGIGIHEKLTEGDPEKWQKVLQTNVMGALRCIRAFVPPMLKHDKGQVVFISSVAGMHSYPYGGVYSASKAALDMIAETLRLEVMPTIKVTVIAAGVTETKFFESQQRSVADLGTGSLLPHDIAEDVWYAIKKRKTATIHKIITRPNSQSF
jgi:NADP-dependent 3-hydroxy acid dehydrogenase YdfG